MSSATHGRLCIVSAAILWSLSGLFTKALTMDTRLGVNTPPIESVSVQIACYRALFAGLVLVPTLRPKHIVFRPMLFVMGAAFALMNVTFISAQALGTAADAILLQNSAPLWLYLVAVFWLGEAPNRRGTIALFFGLAGIAIIIAGGWEAGDLAVVGIGLLSGLTYAGVILSLRLLRDVSSSWLTVWNHLLGGAVLLPIVWTLAPPTWPQFVVLFLFGAIQLGFPYWLMARGLRSVSAAEASALTLLEPILTPVWAWLIAGELPGLFTYIGGAVVVAALAYRYWPLRET